MTVQTLVESQKKTHVFDYSLLSMLKLNICNPSNQRYTEEN